MWGLPPAAVVLLFAACSLSAAALFGVVLVARNTWVLRADSRHRESDAWKLDQGEAFSALRREFANLSADVESDMRRATQERESASTNNARAAKRTRTAPVIEQPRTRAQVRRERLGGFGMVQGGGE